MESVKSFRRDFKRVTDKIEFVETSEGEEREET